MKTNPFSGFADEAADGIAAQLEALSSLGWNRLEARNVDGMNLVDLPDREFEAVAAACAEAGVAIDCFGSTVANWSRDPRSDEDYESSVDELSRALPRMARLGTRYIRGMSFRAIKDARPDSEEIEESVVRKLQRLVGMCADAGVVYLHENCSNFGGLSWEHSLRLVERLDSPAFRLVFDTGNPVGLYDRRGMPWRLQDPLEFFLKVRDFVDRIHIKDAIFIAPTEGIFNEMEYRWPGEGDARIREILVAAISSGFDGAISIEPHMATVYHSSSGAANAEARFENFVEYGRRFESLYGEVAAGIQAVE